MNIQELYSKIKEKSLIMQKNRLKPYKKTITKQSLITILALASTISLCACQTDQLTLNNNTSIVKDQAYETWYEYGIKVYDSKAEEYVSNSVEDYKRIENLSEDDLLGYYALLGMNESEKVVQALGYEGWDDFLIKNNYVNEQGKPDFSKWKRTMQENIGKESEGYHKW